MRADDRTREELDKSPLNVFRGARQRLSVIYSLLYQNVGPNVIFETLESFVLVLVLVLDPH